MELGAFSVSLAARDIDASKLFYEKLGFKVFAGDQSQNRGVSRISEADEGSTGPASFMIADPDGNTILMDQHV